MINVYVLCQYHVVFYYYNSIVDLEIRDGDTSRSSFIVQDCFSYPGLFVFPYKTEYCSFEVKLFLGHSS